MKEALMIVSMVFAIAGITKLTVYFVMKWREDRE